MIGVQSLPESHNVPSSRAREIVRGAYDIHVHSDPDVMERRINDIDLARRCAEVGLAGFVIKSHFVSTAGRAALARYVFPKTDTVGAIALNVGNGGMNPLAVEIAGREGARMVWFPTVDSINEREHKTRQPKDKRPFWARIQDELTARGMVTDPVHVVDDAGNVLPETRRVLQVIAAHDMALATGHLSRDEIFAVVDAAVEEGVRRVVVTHPEFPTQNLSPEDQKALAERGALLERCFTTAHTKKISWEAMFSNIRAAGCHNSVLSSDLGQPSNPPVEDGLALMADQLLAAGFNEDEIHTMAVTNSVRLVAKEG